jgi:hypothetical protein
VCCTVLCAVLLYCRYSTRVTTSAIRRDLWSGGTYGYTGPIQAIAEAGNLRLCVDWTGFADYRGPNYNA